MRRFNLKNSAQKFVLSDFFEHCATLFGFVAYLLLIGGGFILSCIICIATLEFFFPNVIHILNYKVSEQTFTTLYENKHYHAAIYLAELDSTLLGLNSITLDLADSYASVGRFTQAEHLYNQLFEHVSDTTVADSEKSKALSYAARVMVAQSLFKLYERTGDLVGQQNMYAYLKDAYDNPLYIKGTQYFRDTTEVKIWNRTYSVDMRQLLRYDLCRGLRKEQPTAARDSLFSFIQTIYPQRHIHSNLKLAYLNTYIQWCIEDNRPFHARIGLLIAAQIIPLLNERSGYEPLGDYAELCYKLHNMEDARLNMARYLRYMRSTYHKDDLQYLSASLRNLKYNRSSFTQSAFVDQLVTICEGIRETLSMNLPGMTTESREFLVQQLNEPFSYALSALAEYPTDNRLSRLCLENETFKRELLLRSDRILRQALAASTDKQLLSDYQTYLSYLRELLARTYVSGPGNYARTLFLKAETSKLAKRLTAGSEAFALENQEPVYVRQLSKALDSDERLITFVEIPTPAGNTLGCIVLNNQEQTQYIPLCDSTALNRIGSTDVLRLCVEPDTYQTLFAAVAAVLPAQAKVYYSPTGILHRIPLGALQTPDGRVLADHFQLSALSSPQSLLSQAYQTKLDVRQATFALWGGIDYGISHTEYESQPLTRAILRGQALRPLPGSKAEVSAIQQLLEQQNLTVQCYTGDAATERSFKGEVSKATVTHVSTHGFFTEDSTHSLNEVMHNAGLFFANANFAWENDLRETPYRYGFEDGILRAEEIIPENMSQCALVVLSACETGLGAIQENEGVYGLQRAFKLAGVRCLLMSLWSVPDAATSELMRRFYQHLLETGDMDQSLREAQQSMRQSRLPDPLFGVQDWGGFILIH